MSFTTHHSLTHHSLFSWLLGGPQKLAQLDGPKSKRYERTAVLMGRFLLEDMTRVTSPRVGFDIGVQGETMLAILDRVPAKAESHYRLKSFACADVGDAGDQVRGQDAHQGGWRDAALQQGLGVITVNLLAKLLALRLGRDGVHATLRA